MTTTIFWGDYRPIFAPEERGLPGHLRAVAISRLSREFFVPQTVHLVLEQNISRMVRNSYLGRNPAHAIFKRKLNSARPAFADLDLTSYVHEAAGSPASSFTVSGISGAGKSTASGYILDGYPKVIYHPKHHLLQVPWIKLDCPHGGSLSDFCESFFVALDRRLDTNYRRKYASSRARIGTMIEDVRDLCLVHAIGLIVIDEFQHMNLAKSGGAGRMINFLVTLVNVVEVSVVLIGTPKVLHLFRGEFRQARRASGEGSIIWDRLPFDDSWEDFLDELWKFQWLKNPGPRDEPTTRTLYELTQGVPDIIVKLFCRAQCRAITIAKKPSEERISAGLLHDVFEDEFSLVKPLLEALRRGDARLLAESSDLVIPELIATRAGWNESMGSPVPRSHSLSASASAGPISTLVEPASNAESAVGSPVKALAGVQGKAKKQKPAKPKFIKGEDWNTLDLPDLRKMHADGSGVMYDPLKENGYVFSYEEVFGA